MCGIKEVYTGTLDTLGVQMPAAERPSEEVFSCRAFPMGMLWMLRLASLAHRWVLGTCSPDAMAHYIWMEVVCSSGAAINVFRIPERWIHKKQPTEKRIRTAQPLDYFGNSHNIMHMLSVAAMWFIYQGVASESQFMLETACPT